MKEAIKNRIIKCFPDLYGKYILHSIYHIHTIRRNRRKTIKRIRATGQANVLFIASSLSMWRLEKVYHLLKADGRFRTKIIICPFRTFEPEQKAYCIQELEKHAIDNHWDYTVLPDPKVTDTPYSDFDPDIIFYPQLYGRLFNNGLDCEKNLDRLIAYAPYGLPTVSGDWMYNSRYMNTVWKLYFPTDLHLQYARSHSYNHARNMEIVGDSHAEDFVNCPGVFPWKKQEKEKKRIIWAPHFSIGTDGYLHRASFLWLNEVMWQIAQEFKDEVQFVFKPHPRLLSELYRHPEWGKKRADDYYEMWKSGENTQLETGEYIDLFCSSDAMIHDCGSFSAEYHYTGKPVLFVSDDFDAIYQGLDDFGTMCLDLHYHALNVQDIRAFIQDVILQGDDSLREKRELFRKRYLLPEDRPQFAESIYRSIVNSIFGR